MKFIKSKKGLAVLAVLAVAVISAVGAYAYFTSTGTGTGTGKVGTAAGWNVTPASESSNLYPYSAAALTADDTLYTALTGGSVKNDGSGQQSLHQVVATIQTPPSAAGTGPACAVSDFSLYAPTGSDWVVAAGGASATLTPNDDLAPSASHSLNGLSIAMVDNSANQDRCQGQTVSIKFDAS
jgi:hypothetical protein